jgi:dihydrofolate reductase
MRKIIAGMQISIDAKFEGPSGYADWVNAWYDTFDLMPQVDACLLGAAMYPGYEQYWNAIATAPDRPLELTGVLPTPGEIEYARFALRTPHYVLSKNLRDAQWSSTLFLKTVDDIASLKQISGKTIYLVGGAQTISSLLDRELVDELRLTLHPLIAGEGKALFATIEKRHRFRLLAAAPIGEDRVSLRYEWIPTDA